MHAELVKTLSDRGVDILDKAPLASFLERHRVRYTGGIDAAMAAAFRSEEGVGAILVVNLELYDDSTTPKMTLLARLVSTANTPEILWMESFSLTGHENPGVFGLGLVEDPAIIRWKMMNSLYTSLFSYLAGSRRPGAPPVSLPRQFPPRIFYGRETAAAAAPVVAVLPFFNESTRKYASEIMLLHFVHQLYASGRFRPVEPGLIRDKMLAMRVIMNEGISISQADLIANNLETDFVLIGRVFDYQDVEGPLAIPTVDFSAQMMERYSKGIVWTSKSYNKGDEGVWFYDWRRVYTANRLVSGMAKAVVRRLGIPTPLKSGIEIEGEEENLPPSDKTSTFPLRTKPPTQP
jgi:hypothetical protein